MAKENVTKKSIKSTTKTSNKKSTKSKEKTSSTKPVQLTRNWKEWNDLCTWLEINIFGYDGDKIKLHTPACMFLDGLRKGQGIANTSLPMNGEYPMEVILMTFKMHKQQILNSIMGKDFKSEVSKMKYICKIIENHINDVYVRYLNAQKSQEKTEHIDTSIMEHSGAGYKSNVKENKKEDKFKELW